MTVVLSKPNFKISSDPDGYRPETEKRQRAWIVIASLGGKRTTSRDGVYQSIASKVTESNESLPEKEGYSSSTSGLTGKRIVPVSVSHRPRHGAHIEVHPSCCRVSGAIWYHPETLPTALIISLVWRRDIDGVQVLGGRSTRRFCPGAMRLLAFGPGRRS